MDYNEIKNKLEVLNNTVSELKTKKIQLSTKQEGIKNEIVELYKVLEPLGVKTPEDAIKLKQEMEMKLESDLQKLEPKLSQAQELLNNDNNL